MSDLIKQSEWIDIKVVDVKDTGLEELQSMKCKNCGKYHTEPYLYYVSKSKYCPNCGARMEVEDDCN